MIYNIYIKTTSNLRTEDFFRMIIRKNKPTRSELRYSDNYESGQYFHISYADYQITLSESDDIRFPDFNFCVSTSSIDELLLKEVIKYLIDDGTFISVPESGKIKCSVKDYQLISGELVINNREIE